MRKETPKRKPNPADDLLKTSKTKDIELTERELDKVLSNNGRSNCG
jgi:hypothetical protein